MKRGDIGKLRGEVGTSDQPIGAVQLPDTGVRLDRRGNPKPLQSGQDEHEERAPRGPGQHRAKRQPEPELAFTTDLFTGDPRVRGVLTACHKLLAGRQMTSAEVRRKLAAKEFELDMIELGIERCIADGLLDDRRYVDAFVESRVRRGHGVQRIRRDLGQRGIDRAMVDAALLPLSETGALEIAAIEAARKKFARVDLSDAPARAKALRWLVSRGYSSSQAIEALRAVQAEHADALADS